MSKRSGRTAQRIRRENAQERQAERDSRTPKQQLALLDARLGDGVGAEKEREGLQHQIDNTQPYDPSEWDNAIDEQPASDVSEDPFGAAARRIESEIS